MTENQRPQRNKQGQFLVGHEPLIRPTYIYMKHFPKLYCNTCYKGAVCPDYREGFVCAYKKGLRKYKTRNIEEVLAALYNEFNYKNTEYWQKTIVGRITGEFDETLPKVSNKCGRLCELIFHLNMQLERSRSANSPISNDTLEQFLAQKYPKNDTDLPCVHR